MTTVSAPTVSWPRITCTPPTTTTRPVPRIVMVLTITENSDCCHVMAIRAFIVSSPARAKRAASYGSRAKPLTRRIAENVS